VKIAESDLVSGRCESLARRRGKSAVQTFRLGMGKDDQNVHGMKVSLG
jgi:hypothetical protein